MNLNPAKAAERWVQNTQGSVQKYKESIQNLDFNPLERAANDDGRYLAGCQAGDSKRKSKLLGYGGDNWKTITIKKAARLGEGAAASKQKTEMAYQKLFPYIAQGVSNLPRRGSKEMNRARMNAMFDYMSQYKNQY